MQNMRLFIGLHLPHSQCRAIERAQDDLKRQGVTGRYTPVENLHMTLAFLGSCDEKAVDQLVQLMKKIKFRAFSLQLAEGGHFGDLVWIGTKSQPALERLAGQLRKALDRAGFAYDKKPFKPHITILRKAKCPHEFALHADPAEGKISRLTLFWSKQDRSGKIHYMDLFSVDERGRTRRYHPPSAAKQMTRDSKFLSLILRHHPEKIGIRLDRHGWADVDELIEGMARTRDFDRDKLEKIVKTDAKQRYAFNADHTKIRANQGHSIPVDVELKPCRPPAVLWHGTGEKSVDAILREGLKPMGRLYVHLSKDPETARKVGSRHGRPVVFQIDTAQMAEDGCAFYLSANGIWLTKQVPPQYLQIFTLNP
ncbi:MAG: RNA 2'-phosphotransferase [Pseudoramibacter sp.]